MYTVFTLPEKNVPFFTKFDFVTTWVPNFPLIYDSQKMESLKSRFHPKPPATMTTLFLVAPLKTQRPMRDVGSNNNFSGGSPMRDVGSKPQHLYYPNASRNSPGNVRVKKSRNSHGCRSQRTKVTMTNQEHPTKNGTTSFINLSIHLHHNYLQQKCRCYLYLIYY